MLYALLIAGLLATSLTAADLLQGAPCWIQDGAAADDQVWLLCDRDRVFLGRSQGAQWKPVDVPAEGEKLRSIHFLSAQVGFILGDNGRLLTTRDGGRSWTPVEAPTKENLREVSFVGDLGWIAGYGGVVLHSTDAGRTWKLQNTGITQSLDTIFFTDPQNGWAAGWNGTIIRTTDGGKSWKTVSGANAMWSLSSIYFKDPQNGWVVGMFGQILHTNNGGETWQIIEPPTRSWFTNIKFDAAGRGWITTDTDLLVSDDGGLQWRRIGRGEPLFLERLVRVGDSLWAVGPFGVLRQDGQGLEWRKVEFAGKAT